ncbi:MAG TPA: ParB/RepB/Spo0J family partition protein [Ktedonobacteraceae bacterium]|nr:ParB/RepB/Spo0J family partition protein [Ktedonobacteraceae bacterium]
MAKQRFGLGRGLDALISGASDVMATQQPTRLSEDSILQVHVLSIIPNPRQPRKVFREDDVRLLELSASIKEHGLLQPIVVKRLDSAPTDSKEQDDSWFDDDSSHAVKQVRESSDSLMPSVAIEYQIIAGERRWRASQHAGLNKVPVIVKEVTPLQMLEMALIENIQRADLNPIEEALAYQALVQEFGLTQEQVAQQVGKDRSTITNSLRLLQLPPKLRDALVNQPDNFTEGHARAIAGVTREEDQITLMELVITNHLNVRQTEERASMLKKGKITEEQINEELQAKTRPSPVVSDLEAQFRNALMVKVDLKTNPRGKGTLVLHFNNQEELERLYSQLVKKKDQ